MRPLIVANWKMHGLSTQLGAVEAIAATAATAALRGIDILVCPPDTLIERAAQTAARRIAIGGQDCRAEVSGSFTGDTSAEMLKDAGASAVIVGHSDRRQHYAETDSVVAAKASAAWRAGLIAIICVGETAQQRSDGSALEICAAQIVGSVPAGITSSVDSIAYEPLWAIGSGCVPSKAEIADMHAHLRRCLIGRFGATQGNEIRILYGGSVGPENAREILSLPHVGGVLVGKESLDTKHFEAICAAGAASNAVH